MSEKMALHAKGDIHLLRKLWHVGVGLSGLLLYQSAILSPRQLAWSLLGLGLAVLGGELFRLKNPAVNRHVLQVAGPLMRTCEVNAPTGMAWYALGASLALLLFSEQVAILSILFLVFTDPVASWFGIKFGRTRLLPNKSLEGTVAGLVVCYILSLFYCLDGTGSGLNILVFSLCAGLIGTCSELFSLSINDNLSIPLVSGAGLTVLNNLFGIL